MVGHPYSVRCTAPNTASEALLTRLRGLDCCERGPKSLLSSSFCETRVRTVEHVKREIPLPGPEQTAEEELLKAYARRPEDPTYREWR
jgi:hypothetical protein